MLAFGRAVLVALTFASFLFAVSDTGLAADVTYHVEFVGTWSPETHAGAFPGSAHFSDLVGGVHSEAVSFWETGQPASPGIELMAETGRTSALVNEVEEAVDAGLAKSRLLGPSLFGLPSSTSMTLTADESNPLVTLVTMIAPSPDWFVGVSGLSLREEDGWLGRIEVDLRGYDAGTEEGTGFSLGNPATSPQETIQPLTEGPLAELPSLGTFIFTVQDNGLPGDFNLDGQVDTDDLEYWQDGYGQFADGSATVVDGDANADGHVNGSDLFLWQKNYGRSLDTTVTAQSVPEADSLVMSLVGLVIGMVVCSHRRI